MFCDNEKSKGKTIIFAYFCVKKDPPLFLLKISGGIGHGFKILYSGSNSEIIFWKDSIHSLYSVVD